MAATKKRSAARATTKPRVRSAARAGPMRARLSLPEAMAVLEKSGSAQTKKTYLRHGATEPLFGVSFATLKDLLKRIGVDHELACALWDTGNYDARNLAVKVADPAKMKTADLDRWARDSTSRSCVGYVAALASEGPHGTSRANAWLSSRDVAARTAGWSLVGALAMQDVPALDPWLLERLGEIEASIHGAPNPEREAMNKALIALGCRSVAFRKAATAAATRIGLVSVDHGDTACKTPDAVAYISKTWAYSTSKGFESPAAHERSREPVRLRC